MAKQDMKALGALGGKANIAKNGAKRMAKIAVRGGLARWGKLKK